ncbi:low-density lipoprotein receptor-related protein 8-like [Anneissia japonica]|uniref:low-density lipoprotein receptor-related protein 8-like n=1 Tax=Anneissia japonica TaxID=1529436 RepID=UPI001425A357|nr:low-density lipoprotein receptor-related protein 8-like [Anneissia japonica]
MRIVGLSTVIFIIMFFAHGKAMDCDSLKTLLPSVFECATSKECIFTEWECDSQVDCIDKSDEQPEKCLDEWKESCKDFFKPFVCNNGMCIDGGKVCNDIPDCSDGSDENNCSA